MKTTLRRLCSLLLALLMALSLAPSLADKAEDSAIAELGAALVSAQEACDAALTDFKDLTQLVDDLEEQYDRASKKKKPALEEQWLEAMAEQEAAYAVLARAQDELSSLEAEHRALLLITDDCETLTIDYEGKYADLALEVTVDENLVIYDLAAEIDGSERDQLAGQSAFLYRFLGKDLPLTIGSDRKDDIAPLKEAQQTSKDLVAALNTLVYDAQDDAQKGSSGKNDRDAGPLIEPQAIADYIFEHGRLPDNFITKKEAQNLGWDSRENYVSDVAPGYSIGGDRFGNYEGLLPKKKGRTWYEADCYYTGGRRNAYRILYSSDGLVYYTDDHYESFTQMYPSK